MNRTPASPAERVEIRHAVARLRTGILAITGGFVAGTGLAFATAWLVLRGGEVVGPHLSLLGQYYPGYSVSWPGVVVGFVYGFATGAAVGGFVGALYNRLVDR